MSPECRQFQNEIPKALLGDLNPEALQRLKAHLAQCEACRREEQLYTQMFGQLHAGEHDVPVPRHFFAFENARRPSLWTLFRSMSFAWQGAAASAALILAVAGILALASVQLRFDHGAMILSFGQAPVPSPETPKIDTKELEARILQVAEKKRREEMLEWVRTLRREIATGNRQMDQRQRTLIQTALTDLENRMNTNLVTTAQVLQARTDQAVGDLYGNIKLQREKDDKAFTARIQKVAMDANFRNAQTDAILDTLLQVAELRLQQ
jgi:hypothetical protein